MSIICLEGNHGVGKSTLIRNLGTILTESNMCYTVVRDSEYPEFEHVKRLIRSGELSDKYQIIEVVAQARKLIYDMYIDKIIDDHDLTLLDRSYFTSAVWQSSADDDIWDIIEVNESKGIAKADLTLILTAPIDTIDRRLRCRGRRDDLEYDPDKVKVFQHRYELIAGLRADCHLVRAIGEPEEIARDVYSIISENIAL